MKHYKIRGGNKLSGRIKISGAKNVVLKALVAACLTDEKVILHNVPNISDVRFMIEMVEHIGGEVERNDHTVVIRVPRIHTTKLPIETATKMRASSLFFAPFLLREGKAQIPNPGGDKIGARRIDMHIDGLEALGAEVSYDKSDGYFYAKSAMLTGAEYTFKKNTHTGTEQMILASVLTQGTTVLKNTALEPEIDELIELLNLMGGNIRREADRTIRIEGVERLHGAEYAIQFDRNEAVTFAIASALTGGDIWLENVNLPYLKEFNDEFKKVGGDYEEKNNSVRYFVKGALKPTTVTTEIYPGFMTDWQGPWCVLMTQAEGESVIHETIYEDRFQYVKELKKIGADIELFNPEVRDPENFYNFNYSDCTPTTRHAIRIKGKTNFHGGEMEMLDLRAGATIVLAALIADGESTIYGIDQIERGYEDFDKRLKSLGADIEYIQE